MRVLVQVGSEGTYQLLLLHALHEDDEEMLGLRAAVGERLLDGHQQLVPQGLVDDAAEVNRLGAGSETSSAFSLF